MKCLVTGGAGFIGSHIVDRLILDGNEVVVIDNESSESNLMFYWNDKAENYKIDVCDYENTVHLYENVECVFHLAADSRIQPALKNPLRAVHNNVLGTTTALQCSKEMGVKRFIYSSTSSSYGKSNKIPFNENMVENCLNPYSVTKVAGEKMCKMYYDLFGLSTITLRYFNVYGERQPIKGTYAPVIGLFFEQKRNGKPLTIIGDGDQRRDFTYISDVVESNILAMNSNLSGEVLNIGTGINYSINEISKMISEDVIHINPRPGECRETLADNTKAKENINWSPKVSLIDGIEKLKKLYSN
jgi:UDP-glucose 4-epimerase